MTYVPRHLRSAVSTAKLIPAMQRRSRRRVRYAEGIPHRPVNVAVPKPLADALGIFAVHTGTKRVDIIQELLVHMLRDWEDAHLLPEGWDVGES